MRLLAHFLFLPTNLPSIKSSLAMQLFDVADYLLSITNASLCNLAIIADDASKFAQLRTPPYPIPLKFKRGLSYALAL
jgi:hypothetical protein